MMVHRRIDVLSITLRWCNTIARICVDMMKTNFGSCICIRQTFEVLTPALSGHQWPWYLPCRINRPSWLRDLRCFTMECLFGYRNASKITTHVYTVVRHVVCTANFAYLSGWEINTFGCCICTRQAFEMSTLRCWCCNIAEEQVQFLTR